MREEKEKNNKSEKQIIENKLNNHNCRSEKTNNLLNHTLILFASGK
jgi:hypothetical protein